MGAEDRGTGVREHLGRIERLSRELADSDIERMPLRERVLRALPLQEAVTRLGPNLMERSDDAAMSRLIEYLLETQGQTIRGAELRLVAGIDEWARRVRQLRVEHGWLIRTGATDARLRPDEYVLDADARDEDRAERWRIANRIRRDPTLTSAKAKILRFLEENVGRAVAGKELQYVAGDTKEWARRVRELRTEDGRIIQTGVTGRPDLRPDQYVLASLDQLPLRERRITAEARAEVLNRDQYACTTCGWSRANWTGADARFIEVHHVHHHARDGSNQADNLVTLCNRCHDDRHARE